MSVIRWWCGRIALIKRAICSKRTHMFFTVLPPFLFQKSVSLLSLFAQLLFFKDRWDRFTLAAVYKRVTVSESLPPLFTKELPWANCSHHSLKKSDGSNSLCFSRANRSFNHKKRAIRLKPMIKFPTLSIGTPLDPMLRALHYSVRWPVHRDPPTVCWHW